MFNRKLLAGSMFALMSSSALAVDFDYAPDTVSVEGSASLVALELPEVEITVQAEYQVGDVIDLVYSVPLTDAYTAQNSLLMYATCENTDSGAVITGDADENGGIITIGFLSSDAASGSVSYRITETDYSVTSVTVGGAAAVDDCATSTTSSIGAVVVIGSAGNEVEVDGPAARAAGVVTGTYAAETGTGSNVIDGGLSAMVSGTDTSLVTFQDQFADDANADLLAGTVDVGADDPRSEFADVTPGGATTYESALITLSDAAGAVTLDATLTSVTFTLNGDFSFLVDEDAVAAGIQNDAFTVDYGGGTDIPADSVTADALTWNLAGAAIDDITLDFSNAVNGDGTQPIADGSFTYSVTIEYEDNAANAGSLALTSDAAAGVWLLNGSETVINNYPLSRTAVDHFVYVTNTSGVNGAIVATAIGGIDGQEMPTCELGTALDGEVISIRDELNDCLTAAGMTSGRAQITVTVNADADEINVYAGYRHIGDGDRLNLTQ